MAGNPPPVDPGQGAPATAQSADVPAPEDQGVTDSGIDMKIMAGPEPAPEPTGAPGPATLETGGAIPATIADQQPPPLKDSMIEARLNDHDWAAIDQHLARFKDTAAQWGYSDQQVDDHVGKPAPLDTFGPLPYTELHLDPNLITQGVTRPLGPTEWMRNPDGGWSNEMTNTVEVNGKPSVVPGLWLVNGQPTHLTEDQSAEMAEHSGLKFPSFATEDEAEKFSEDREAHWQKVEPGSAGHLAVPGLWTGQIIPNSSPIPDTKAAVDYPIGVAQTVGSPDVPLVKQAQSNMLDMAIRTGTPFDQIYKAVHTDPIFQDAITSNQSDTPDRMTRQTIDAYHRWQAVEPQTPTLAELEKGGEIPIRRPYIVPYEHFLWEPEGSLKNAAIDFAADTAGVLAGIALGKYIIAPAARFVMSTAGPPLEAGLSKLTGTIKDVFADESGQLKAPKPQTRTMQDTNGTTRTTTTITITKPTFDWMKSRGGQTELEDELYRMRKQDSNELHGLLSVPKALPAEWRTDEFQDKLYHYTESKGTNQFKPDPEMDKASDVLGPLQDKQYERAVTVDHLLHEGEEGHLATRIRHADEGYVHRMAADDDLNATPGAEQDFMGRGAGQRSLSRWASGMQSRGDDYAIEGEKGGRKWGGEDLPKGVEFGQKFHDPVTNEDWTYKPATTQEIMTNTDREYNTNYVQTLLENLAETGRVERNLKLLQKIVPDLTKQGKFFPRDITKPIGKDFAGEKVIFGTKRNPGLAKAPSDFKEVDLPQMKGRAEPKLADTLNDFFHGDMPNDSLLNKLRASTTFALHTLFLDPLIHGENMTTQWLYSRGLDWINPYRYGSLVRNTVAAASHVWNRDAVYKNMAENGSALRSVNIETRNFSQVLHEKFIHDMQADPKTWGAYAKAFGMTLPHLVGSMLEHSEKFLSTWEDTMRLSRQLELTEKGMSTREAIFQSEKDIANYRIPTWVLGSHAIARYQKDPAFSLFGRYHYGLMRAMALMANDIVRGSAGERAQAIGKATSIAGMSLFVWPLISYGLTQAGQAATGDPNFRAYMRSTGILGPITAAAQAPGRFAAHQMNYMGFINTLVGVAPWLSAMGAVGKAYSEPFFNPYATKLGMTTEAIQGVGDNFYAAQLLMRLAQEHGMEKDMASLLGGSVAYAPSNPPKLNKNNLTPWQQMQESEQMSKERHNSLESVFQSVVGGGPPPAKAHSSFGKGGAFGGAKKFGETDEPGS